MFKHLQKDALIAGFISIFIVLAADMLILITALSLLSDYYSSDLLYLVVKVFSIASLAFPPYVAARAAPNDALLHSFIIGLIQAFFMIALMTQTFSWQGTLQDDVIERIPLVAGGLLILSLIAGIFARWMNQKDQN